MATEPSKSVEPVTAVRSVVPQAKTVGALAADSFAPLRALVEQMVKDAHEEGRRAGVVDGRVEGLRRARALLGIAMGQLSIDDRSKLNGVVELVEHELMK